MILICDFNFSFYVSVTTQAGSSSTAVVSTPTITTSNNFDHFFTTQPVQPGTMTTPGVKPKPPKPDDISPQPVVTTKPILDDLDDNGIICPTYTRNSATNTAWSHADWVKSFEVKDKCPTPSCQAKLTILDKWRVKK